MPPEIEKLAWKITLYDENGTQIPESDFKKQQFDRFRYRFSFKDTISDLSTLIRFMRSASNNTVEKVDDIFDHTYKSPHFFRFLKQNIRDFLRENQTIYGVSIQIKCNDSALLTTNLTVDHNQLEELKELFEQKERLFQENLKEWKPLSEQYMQETDKKEQNKISNQIYKQTEKDYEERKNELDKQINEIFDKRAITREDVEIPFVCTMLDYLELPEERRKFEEAYGPSKSLQRADSTDLTSELQTKRAKLDLAN